MIGDKARLAKARVYMQQFMPFEYGNPNGWILSKENIEYIGKCHVLKTIKKEVAELATRTLRSIEGLFILGPTVSELEN
jgi:hypothetical protein